MNKMLIKEKGKAGLHYAYDSKDQYVPAENAENGVCYFCPFCKCKMHVTTTKASKRIYIRYPGQTHTNPACITIERDGTERSFENLDPEKFITSLCCPKSDKPGPGGNNPGGGNGRGTTTGGTDENDKFGKLASFSSLAQIAKSGISLLNANDMQGAHPISDFIMTYKYANNFFPDPTFVLGARIVYARYSWANANNRSIIFSMFWGNNRCAVKFCLYFPHDKDFMNYKKKFEPIRENVTGKTIPDKSSTNRDVLIASDEWSFIDKSQCSSLCFPKDEYCKKCYGMYHATFCSTKQIYLM